MTPRMLVALADDIPPPRETDHTTIGIVIAIVIALAAIAGGLWLAKRRGSRR